MSPSSDGRVAAVTGASSGIGEATALALAQAGYAVALGARRADRLEALARRIEQAGGRDVALPGDVTDEAEARAFVEGARERLGRLDVLVNNAGLMLLGAFEQQDAEDWRRMMGVNVMGLLYCTAPAVALLREQGEGGTIVNVSSVAGRVTAAESAVYNLTKWGVSAFSEALRQGVRDAGIRVVCLEPGYVETELREHLNEAGQEAERGVRATMDETLLPEDMASVIVYAVSVPARVSLNEVLVRPTGQAR